MFRNLLFLMAFFGACGIASAQSSGQRTQKSLSQASHGSLSDTHIPSAGITLETLQSLPPPYRHWANGRPIIRPTWNYQPYYVTPSFSYGYPFQTYGFVPRGLGGYTPQGVGGRYRSNISLFIWY